MSVIVYDETGSLNGVFAVEELVPALTVAVGPLWGGPGRPRALYVELVGVAAVLENILSSLLSLS